MANDDVLWHNAKRAVHTITIEQARLELAVLEDEWDAFMDVLKEEGGMAGSPGEWMADRMSELRRAIEEGRCSNGGTG